MPDPLLDSLRQRLPHEAGPALWGEIEHAALARHDQTSGHADWGLLAEEAGLLNLAFREFQLALRDEPAHPVAAFRLAHHYRERGEPGRAADLLERLLATNRARDDWLALYVAVLQDDNATPRARAALEQAVRAGLPPERAAALARTLAPDEPEETPDEDEELAASDADCARFAALFAGRENVHARQWARRGGEGGYSPVHEPLTPAVVRNHLLGSCTVGVYPIRLDGTCTFFALDLDIDKSTLEEARRQPAVAQRVRDDLRAEAARLLGVLRGLGLPPLFENSGYKGRHFWVFLEQPETAEVLHLFGRQLLAWQGPQLARGLHLEFFPKQGGRGGKGLGNLIKVPLGIHRRTGHRSALLDDVGQPLPAPLAALRQVQRLPRAALYAAIERLKGMALTLPLETPGDSDDRVTPPTPLPAAGWTEADFETDPRIRHLLAHCPVLAELKRSVDEQRRLSHEEQLVLIHTLGHVEGGPLAVNYLLGKCVDVAPEKFMKDRLKGNPVSCPSIRKKIGHVTRRVPCNCPFEFAPNRYPTPVLHLLTLPATPPPAPPAPAADVESLARRFAVLEARKRDLEREHAELRQALIEALRTQPQQQLALPGGRWRLVNDEPQWEPQ